VGHVTEGYEAQLTSISSPVEVGVSDEDEQIARIVHRVIYVSCSSNSLLEAVSHPHFGQ
jgi:hypothetical protein